MAKKCPFFVNVHTIDGQKKPKSCQYSLWMTPNGNQSLKVWPEMIHYSRASVPKGLVFWRASLCEGLKVRLSQNGFMKSSIFQKLTQKIWRISALRVHRVHRAEVLQIVLVIIWKIDDFINPFWFNLTFRCLAVSLYLWQFPSTLSGSFLYNFNLWQVPSPLKHPHPHPPLFLGLT